METKTFIALISPFEQYSQRFQVAPPEISTVPTENLYQIVVIPCFDEPNPKKSLEALAANLPTQKATEVILVVNQSEKDQLLPNNQQVLENFSAWKKELDQPFLHFYLIDATDLPHKHAGVGLARKRGMDEAVHRFAQLNRPDGVITCFDADSLCSANYLATIEAHFLNQPKVQGASIYFEHPLEGLEKDHQKAIYEYELFLRYYVEGLRFAQHPFAFHTIGSSMAVRASAYMKQGGMNKRKAGEDFYFLQKIIPSRQFIDIVDCAVIPSPRESHRVPFGTGKAITDALHNHRLIEGYDPDLFSVLKDFHSCVSSLFVGTDWSALEDRWPTSLVQFLNEEGWKDEMERIRSLSKNRTQFDKQFFAWWDGFKVLKAIHYLRDHWKPSGDVILNAQKFAQQQLGFEQNDILSFYRNLQKQD